MSKEKQEQNETKKDEATLQYKHLKSLLRHIKNVHEAAVLLGERLIEKGEVQFGINLIMNSLKHDQSKFKGIEWDYLVRDSDKEMLSKSHEQHVETNEHHPEYWGDINQMPRIYIAEMVCDMYARSTEMGTNLREYIKEQALPRYKVSPRGKVYKMIKEFLDLLLDEPFKEIK